MSVPYIFYPSMKTHTTKAVLGRGGLGADVAGSGRGGEIPKGDSGY